MKKLVPPIYDDAGIIDALAANNRLSSFPLLQQNVAAIKARYLDYVANSGNARLIGNANIQPPLDAALRHHYDFPPGALGCLKELRNHGSPKTCPMCGGFGTGTLDHIFPKGVFSEYAIFTKNLVPACDCNLHRDNTIAGVNPDERILHPYFDECLASRLVSCSISGDDLIAPEISVISVCDDADKAAVEFHIDAVIRRTEILRWLDDEWLLMIRKPRTKLPRLQDEPIDLATLEALFADMLTLKDEEFDSLNNWGSIFYSGVIASPGVMPWLVTRINGLQDGTVQIE